MSNIREEKRTSKKGKVITKYLLDYRDIAGRRFKERYDSKEEAKRRLAEIEYNKSIGVNLRNNKKLKFSEAADIFINTYAPNLCKPSTLDSYRSYLKNHLNYFDNIPLAKITPLVIEEFKKEKLQALSAKSVNHCLSLISSIFETVIKEGMIIANPMKQVKNARQEYKEMIILTLEEVGNMLFFAKTVYPDFYPLLLAAFTTGARRGELLALTWKDLDFSTDTMRINKTLYKGKPQDCKTRASIRTIVMTKDLADLLYDIQEKAKPDKTQPVFANEKGEYLDPDNMYKRRFKRIVKKVLPEHKQGFTFHSIRHCSISLMVYKNVPMRVIQKQHGHSSITTTIDRYSKVMPETEDNVVYAMDDLFGKEIKKMKKMNIKPEDLPKRKQA